MFNFYVNLAGHDKITDAGRSTTCRRILKPHHYKQKVHKTKDISETWVSTAKTFEDFRQKFWHFLLKPSKSVKNTDP